MNFMTFHSVGMMKFPTDELIFFREVGIPPTSYIPMGKTWQHEVRCYELDEQIAHPIGPP